MTEPIHIRLLGGFSISGARIAADAISAPRQQALLAYLLLHRYAPQSRQQIAFQLWPDSTDAQAQTNLRQLLYHLRNACPAVWSYIKANTQTLHWQGEPVCTLDVADFEERVMQAERAAEDEAVVCLQEAVSLYAGDLFPNCYEEWIVPQRQRLRSHYVTALQQLIDILAARHDLPQAITTAEKLLSYDPLHEATYRRLMQLHALNHNRGAALHTYHICVATLKRELDVSPDQETQAQYERILGAEGQELAPHPSVTLRSEPLPLVGRVREWAKVQQAWGSVHAGRAHFVLIRGEAGIGKTRLLEEIGHWASLQGVAVAQAHTYMGQDRLAYAPVAAWLRSQVVQEELADLDPVWLTEVARLLPELLVERPDLPPPQPLTDSWQRQRFYDALTRPVLKLTEERPLLLLLDDLQWCDRETSAWFTYLLAQATNRPLLFVATMRTGDVTADHPVQATLAAWRQERSLTEIMPRPLDSEETMQVAEAVAGQEWDAGEAGVLYRETEGNPLFIVEMVRAGREQLGDEVGALVTGEGTARLPPRMRAVIEARLRGLGDVARELVELAAVIGRDFRFDVLARASRLDDEALVRGLDELWGRHIIREQGTTGYDFSHDKLRAVAYDQISTARRRLLHGRVALALAAIHAHDTDAVSARLARHYEQAGMVVEAVRAYRQAAGVAQRVYANEDVVTFLEEALALVETLPPGAERDTQELSFLAELGPPLVALEGYSAERVTAVYDRMLELCARLDQPPDPRALRGLGIARILQARYSEAAGLGREILALEKAARDPVLATEGHYVVGVASFWQGEFTTARESLEQALAYFSPARRSMHVARYAQDPEVVCRSRLAYTLWHLGYPEQAWQTMDKTIASRAAQDHPYSLAYARAFAASLAASAQDDARLNEEVPALLELTTKHHFDYFYRWALLLQGHAQVREGLIEAGMAQIRAIALGFAGDGRYLDQPLCLGWLAQAEWRAGRADEALYTLEQALAVAEERGERYHKAELHRQYGEWLWQQGETVGLAVTQFEEALMVARLQGARLFELRTLVTLFRFWREVGDEERVSATRDALQSTYDCFTEGYDTPDLRAARAVFAAGAA